MFSIISGKKSKNPVFIDFEYDELKSVKRLAVTKRITGIIAATLVVLLLAFVLGQGYLPQIIKGLRGTEDTVDSGTSAGDISTEEAVAYDKVTGLAIYSNSFNLQVINASNPADETRTVDTVEACGVQVDKRIADALTMMTEAAENDGVELSYESGYVSYDEQEIVYNSEVLRLEKSGSTYLMSRAQAKKTVLYPGEADAQTGLSVAVSYTSQDFSNTQQFKWLNENAANYGFIFRYPEWKTSYTGNDGILNIIRYVGTENSSKMRQLSMCLEEYRDYIYNRD